MWIISAKFVMLKSWGVEQLSFRNSKWKFEWKANERLINNSFYVVNFVS